MTAETPPLRRVMIWLCDPCAAGKGGECHTPGCSFWMRPAPEAPPRSIFTPNMDLVRELTFDEDEEQVNNAWIARAADILRGIEAVEIVLPEGPWLRQGTNKGGQ